MHWRFAGAGLLGIFGAVACSGGKTAGTPLPCDVATVMVSHCQQCHADPPLYGAPMPLVTWEDLHAPAKSDASKQVYELVGTRIHDDAAPMPQPPNPRLSAADTATLDSWVAAGAPAGAAGDAQCGQPLADGGADDGTTTPSSCDTHLAPGSPWSMPLVNDQYACYAVDLTPAQKEHVIRFQPRIDNTQIVHHIVLFQSASATKYTSTPQACPSFGELGWSFVYAWAPGGAPFDLPPEAGYPVEGTTHYIVQVHYNNIQMATGQTDTSGFDLCTTTTLRPNDADVVAFGSMKFSIPAHGSLDITCKSQLGSSLDGVHVFASMPHMHKIGTAISASQISGSSTVDMGTEDPFNFNAQSWLPVSNTLAASDIVATRCAWNNTTSSNVSFGENTEDEMCFVFSMYYPKKSLLSWSQYAATSVCNPTQ
jgi:cytochrome c551/c552